MRRDNEFYLKFSTLAQDDIDSIHAYTIETWGTRQLDVYSRLFEEAFERIRRNPETGRENFPPYRNLRVGHHIIFYRLTGNIISITRILHERMDFIRHLTDRE